MRVLILDDDEIDRMAVRRALWLSGMTVELVEADTLVAARSLLRESGSIDAIVADYLLPDGSANDLLRELRKDGGPGPPIVVLTGQGDERVAVELMKAGAADYLPKSELAPRRLRKVLRSAVRVAAAERRAHEAQRAQQRLLKELQEERKRLERAVAERDEVLAIVSHDLRSPLSNVAMALESLSGSLEPEERARIAGLANRAVERMVRLIEDLLDVARIEQGGLALQLEEHDAGQLAVEVIDAVRLAAERGGVRLDVSVPPDLGRVRVDRARLAQAFQNLLSNALRYTRAGGCVRVSASVDGGTVRYLVHDDGPGIPEDARPHVFERFWQARREERSGAGLGLAIVKGIVEAHGGTVGLADVERGACFELRLPRVAPAARRAS
ncbi:MAG TPA: hybrid sensor histidine kinase/response regulator [Sandaracinaceae bacterium]